MSRRAEEHFSKTRGLVKLWAGWLIAPIAWALHGQTSYLLVFWVCGGGWHFTLHLVTLGTLALAGAGICIAWRNWKEAGGEPPKDHAGVINRSRFMALGGLFFSGYFFVVILAHGVPNFFLDACMRAT